MNTSSITNYQTSFRIENNDGAAFDAVLRSIYDWLSGKEKDGPFRRGWATFRYRGLWNHLFGTRAKIVTETYLEDERKTWAVEYTHPDKELGAKRFWYTQVGVREMDGDLIVCVRVSYAWNRETLSHELPDPAPSVPYFVRQLLEKFRAFSGRREFRLIKRPLLFNKPGQGKLLWDFLVSQDRRYPLVIFNGDTEVNQGEARRLATQLAGKCQVIVVSSDPELRDEMGQYFPRDYAIAFGRMRVFFPISPKLNMPARHRFYDVQSPEYSEQREGILNGLLRNHNLLERQAVATVDEVRRLVARSNLIALQKNGEDNSEELTQLIDYMNEVESERDSAKNEAGIYAQMVDALEAEKSSLEWKCKALETTATPEVDLGQLRKDLFSLPANLADVVRMASAIHAGRLVFAKQAFKSAEEDSKCELVADAWIILSHLATTLWELKFESDNPIDLAKVFTEKSGYEYAETEGKQTKINPNLCRLRRLEHDGKIYEIWPHIKRGNKGLKMIRIHFAYDDEKRMILVGFVGLHMDNATTRNKK